MYFPFVYCLFVVLVDSRFSFKDMNAVLVVQIPINFLFFTCVEGDTINL